MHWLLQQPIAPLLRLSDGADYLPGLARLYFSLLACDQLMLGAC